MATTPHGSSNASSAEFDMTQQLEMWSSFNRMFKWGGTLVLILLVGMAIFLTGSPPQP